MRGMRIKSPKAIVTIVTALCSVGVAIYGASAHAAAADPLIDGARLCTQRFPLEEKSNNIPTHLLAAIATTESGRWHEGLGMNVPWPWTVNVEGKGYYFNNKAEAIAQTRTFLTRGYKSIDVGCMQVNLKHHPKAFASLDQAFDPVTNVSYAAKFLRENYADLGDWIKATAAYHSRTPVHGQRYLGNIERSWNRIVAKVSAARASIRGETPAVSQVQQAMAATKPVVISPPKRPAVESKPMQPSQKVRVISVSDELSSRKNSPVMVVRPTTTEKVVKVADAASPTIAAELQPMKEPLPVGNSVRRVRLDNSSETGVATPKEPTFVFAN